MPVKFIACQFVKVAEEIGGRFRCVARRAEIQRAVDRAKPQEGFAVFRVCRIHSQRGSRRVVT